MLLHPPASRISQIVFRFFARASTFSLKRTVPRLAVAANLAFALLLRLVMVSLALAYHVTIRLVRERQRLTSGT